MSLSCAKARAEARIIRSSSLSHDSRSSGSSQLNRAADERAESLRAACDKGNSCGRTVEKARSFPFVKSYAQKHAAGRSTQPNRVSSIVGESWRKRGRSTENKGQGARE